MAPPSKSIYSFRILRCNISLTMSLWLIFLIAVTTTTDANAEGPAKNHKISLSRITRNLDAGYGYKLEYYVPAPLDAFWRFKTDFQSEILSTNKELIGHRLVKTSGNSVVTENRYASAPGLSFLWQTTVIPGKFRLEFELLNPEDCRHEFHHGSIQLSPAGAYTKVTQVAFFDFRGAAFWVKYPWYGE